MFYFNIFLVDMEKDIGLRENPNSDAAVMSKSIGIVLALFENKRQIAEEARGILRAMLPWTTSRNYKLSR